MSDKNAAVSETARIGEGTALGEYCVVEPAVRIGRGCFIGHHAVLHSGTVIGDGVRIDDFACVGKLPMRAANSATTAQAAPAGAVVGDGCIIGTHAVVYAGCVLETGVLVADLATVREDVRIGQKTIVGRGASVENHCEIGALCKIETNAYLTAYSKVEDRCFVAPGVVTSNDNFAGRTKQRFAAFRGVTVKTGGRIGAGAVILPGRVIEEDGFAAAGSVVTKDVTGGTVVAGNPARALRPVPEDQLLKNQEQSGGN